MRASIDMCVQQKDWVNAAIRANNLSELELTLGDVRSAEATAAQAVTFADQSGDESQRMIIRTTHADALHQAGRVEDSRRLFAQAEALQAARQPAYPLLYSLGGYRYCDLLLAAAERDAWGATVNLKSEISNSRFSDLAEVHRRATQTLEWVTRARMSLLTIALDHLTLGRVQLLGLVLGWPEADRTRARTALDTALATLRDSNNNDDLPRALLPDAWLHALSGDWDRSRQRLDEAYALATRGGRDGSMKLHLIDTLLHRARLFGRMKDEGGGMKEYPWPGRTPQQDLEEAGRLIAECGYHRRDPELATARAALAAPLPGG